MTWSEGKCYMNETNHRQMVSKQHHHSLTWDCKCPVKVTPPCYVFISLITIHIWRDYTMMLDVTTGLMMGSVNLCNDCVFEREKSVWTFSLSVCVSSLISLFMWRESAVFANSTTKLNMMITQVLEMKSRICTRPARCFCVCLIQALSSDVWHLGQHCSLSRPLLCVL